MQLKLDMSCHLLNVYTKFQIDISKHVEEKSGKRGRTDGRTDGQTDRRTDGHCHGIIRPVFQTGVQKPGCLFWVQRSKWTAKYWIYCCTLTAVNNFKPSEPLFEDRTALFCKIIDGFVDTDTKISPLNDELFSWHIKICEFSHHFPIKIVQVHGFLSWKTITNEF